MRRGSLLRIGSLLLALLAASCATLPDTAGYTAATVQMRQSARPIGGVVAAEIAATADATEDAAAQAEIRRSGDRFAQAWESTLVSLGAAVRYAESIEEIAHAGTSGAATADKVANAVSSFATKLGLPAASAVGAAADTGAFVYKQIALIRAARSLAAALDAADPAIDRLQALMHTQVEAARVVFVAAVHAQESELRLDTGLRFYALRDQQLEPEEKARLNALVQALLDPTATPARIAPLQARAAAVRSARGGLADGLARYTARRNELAKRRGVGIEVFKATDEAITAWAAAHARLASAVRERKPVTAASLLAASDDLRDLVSDWRKL